MSDELRAACESLIYASDRVNELLPGLGPRGPMEVATELARLYLAEHPADDAEPVTEEWLRAVGFTDDSYDNFSKEFRGVAVQGGTKGPWGVYNMADEDFTRVHPMPTRRHVRLLCKALGIPLKEPS